MTAKTTAKLLSAEEGARFEAISLLKHDIVREQAFEVWEQALARVLDAFNHVLTPLIETGYPTLASMAFVRGDADALEKMSSKDYLAYSLDDESTPLAYLAVDRCTLNQLAGCLYGSQSFQFFSPMRKDNNSDLRQANRLFASFNRILAGNFGKGLLGKAPKVLKTKKLNEIDPRCSLMIELGWPASIPLSPIRLLLGDELLSRIHVAEQESDPAVSEQLDAQIKAALQDLPVTLKFELGRASLPIHRLDSLAVGDIIPVSMHSESPVQAQGAVLFHSSVHSHDGQLVGKLTRISKT